MINTLNDIDGNTDATQRVPTKKNDHALASAATAPDVRRFKLEQIRVGDNAREDFDAEEMRRLVESMRQSREKIGSTLQPLLGVLKDDGTVELIAGERRFRAAPEAGYEELEVKVLTEVKTRDVLIWNLTENTIRANLKPTEKAKRIVALLAMTDDSRPVFSRASLAEELGEDANSIDHCVNLMKAPEKVRAAIDAGTSLEIGGMIGALPPEQQTDAANAILFGPMGAMGVMAARDYIAEHCRRDLRKAQWSKEDADLVPTAGACTKCPQWGGEHTGVVGKNRVHVCLNPRCYEEKTRAFQLKIEARAEDEKTKVLHESGRYFKTENNEVKPDCGYIDLRDKPDAYLLDAGRTAGTPRWDKILKDSAVPQVIAFDHQGRARNLVESALAITAAKLSPHAGIFRTNAGDNVKTQDEKKIESRIAKAQKTATQRVIRDACIELHQGIQSSWGWGMLFELYHSIVSTCGHQREDGELLLSVLDPNAKPAGDLWQQLAEQIRDKLKHEEQLGAFVVLARNIRGIRYNGLSHIEHQMAEICDAAEFNTGKWSKTLEAEMKSAAEGAKGKDKEKRRQGDKESGEPVRKVDDYKCDKCRVGLYVPPGQGAAVACHLKKGEMLCTKHGGTWEPWKSHEQALGLKPAKAAKGKEERGLLSMDCDAAAFYESLMQVEIPKMKHNANGVFEQPVLFKRRFGKGCSFAIFLAMNDDGWLSASTEYTAHNASGGALPNEGHRYDGKFAALKEMLHELKHQVGRATPGKSFTADHKKMKDFIQEVNRLLLSGEMKRVADLAKTKKPHGGVPEVDPKVKAKARKLYDAGKGKDAIAKELGISPNTVGNWQKREWPKRKK